MPTAARLFALFGFAAMAFFATEIYKPLLPRGTPMGLFTPVNMALAGIAGWSVMGRLAGQGWAMAAVSGLRTTAVAVFYALLTWAGVEMLERSLDKRYDGPVEALQQMVALVIDYARLGLTDPQVPVAILGGGILAGFLSEWAARQGRQTA
jgi:hypothetical protein